MQNRNPIVVILLTLVTFGFYGIYWEIVTANEMRDKGAEIPHWILLIVPIANLFWYYKYSLGVEQVSNGRTSGILTFVFFLFFPFVSIYLAQTAFNEVGNAPTAGPGGVSGSAAFTQHQPIPAPGPLTTGATAAPIVAPAQQVPAPEVPVFTPQPVFTAPTPEPTPVVTPVVESPIIAPQEPVAFTPAPTPLAEPVSAPAPIQTFAAPAAPTVITPDVVAPVPEPVATATPVFEPQVRSQVTSQPAASVQPPTEQA